VRRAEDPARRDDVAKVLQTFDDLPDRQPRPWLLPGEVGEDASALNRGGATNLLL